MRDCAFPLVIVELTFLSALQSYSWPSTHATVQPAVPRHLQLRAEGACGENRRCVYRRRTRQNHSPRGHPETDNRTSTSMLANGIASQTEVEPAAHRTATP